MGDTMSTINVNGTMAFSNPNGGSVTIIPKNDTATNYTINIPDVSGTLATQSYVLTNGVPSGVITMWSGSIASIPAGWALCNGVGNTPNLMDKFIVGAGSTYAVAATGGSKDSIVVAHSHTFSATTSSGGLHRHGGYSNANLLYAGGGGRANDAPDGYATGGRYWETLDNGTHSHTVSGTSDANGSSGTNANLPPYYALAYIMKL
jgi:hypothetical protein